MITFDNVSFAYTEVPSLHDLSFTVEPGETVALVGPNGAGKTTASKLMNGLLKPTSGRVTTRGLDVAKARTSELARYVGYLFQNPDSQICKNTVVDEIRFGLDVSGADRTQAHDTALAMCGTLALEPDASPFSLSRGEKQRVVMGSIIILEPEILVLDEPTTGLDARASDTIMSLVAELAEKGTTIIMITHDMALVQRHADRVLVFSAGRLVAEGAPDDIFSDHRLMASAALEPPQVIDVSQRLSALHPGLPRATNVDALVTAVTRLTERSA